MSKFVIAAVAAAGFVALAPSTASAQNMMAPGAELYGQQVQVLAGNGETNSLYFSPDGTVQLSSMNGQSATGNWYVQNNMLCISASGARECWPYRAAFQARQPVTLVSDCGATSQWTAMNVNMQQPMQRRAGERG